MSIVPAILAGTLVLWLATYGPVYLGVLPRGSGALPTATLRHHGAMLLLGSLIISTCAALLQVSRGAQTINEAIFVGFLLGLIPAAARAGTGMREGTLRHAVPAALLLLAAPVAGSVAIVLVR
jgi:hypothetical protein